MGIIAELPRIIEKSKAEWEKALGADFRKTAEIGAPNGNMLCCGDNLNCMKYLLENQNMAGKIKLIYIDPPFFSEADYEAGMEIFSEKGDKIRVKQHAYTDNWNEGAEEYLKMLSARLYAMRELLSDDGIIWLHLDWHISHYARILMDEVFGEGNFINEVVWTYKSGGSSKRHFSRKHDTLLVYSKTKKYEFFPLQEKSYNRELRPYRFKGVKEYKDDIGWYTLVNMKDVWQIDMVGRTAGERTGYATQKPEALMERIIESCSRPGDTVADFFGGSGSFAAAATKMGRQFIYCDNGQTATAKTEKRLLMQKAAYSIYTETKYSDRTDREKPETAAQNDNKDKIGAKVKEELGCPEIIIGVEYGHKIKEEQQVRIFLKEYSYDAETLKNTHVSEKDLEKIKIILNSNYLGLIEYWYIDYNYDGLVLRPKDVFFRTGKDLVTEIQRNIGLGKEIAVKAVDAFGGIATASIKSAIQNYKKTDKMKLKFPQGKIPGKRGERRIEDE